MHCHHIIDYNAYIYANVCASVFEKTIYKEEALLQTRLYRNHNNNNDNESIRLVNDETIIGLCLYFINATLHIITFLEM